MHSYIADSGQEQVASGWFGCLLWAKTQIESDPTRVVKLFHTRPGEKQMRIVAEVSDEGVRLIQDGRHTRLKKV